MKVVFKLARPPVVDQAQRQSPSPMGQTLGPPISPAPVSSPGAPTPKLGRLVIKTNTPTPPTTTYADSSAPRTSPFVFKSAGENDMDVDGRNKKRDLRIDVDAAPVPKRKKEIEIEDDLIDVSGIGVPAERARKKWVPMRKALNIALKKLIEYDGYKFFYEPVSEKDAPGYFQVIKHPMDFVTMRKKLNEDKYPYWSLFTADFELICQNCISYNPPNSIYWSEAKNLLLEGKKYLKIQGTKIDPALLQPPGDFNTTSSLGPSSASSSASHATQDHRAIVMLEMPKRFYIKNSDLPLHLLAPPPPVHILKGSHFNAADSNSTSPSALYHPTNEVVAQHTPQQQRLQKPTEYPLFTIGPSDSSHWGKSIPTYIQHTRGHPAGGSSSIFHAGAQNLNDPAGSAKPVDSLSSRWLLQQQHLYQQISSRADRERYQRSIESFTTCLSDDTKRRLADLGQILSSPPSTLDSSSFSQVDGTYEIMNIGSDLLDDDRHPLTVPRDTLAELKTLKSTLSSTHLDLSFLDKLFKADITPEAPANAMTTKKMLDRNAILIQQLSAAMQSRRIGTPISDAEQSQITELSANLMTLHAQIQRTPSLLQAEILDQLRTAVRLGLPSIPGAHLPAIKMES